MEQARDLMARLEGMGATVLLFPAVSFSEPSDTAELDRAIRSLGEFDWILFTSANAVRFFARRCRKLGVEPDPGWKLSLRGGRPGNRQRRGCGGISGRPCGAGISWRGAGPANFPRRLPERRFCCRAASARGPICRMRWRRVGAEVTEVVAYHTGGLGVIEPGVMRAIREAQVDVISFFSPSAIENMRGELGEEVLSRLGAKAALAAVGPVTAAALRDAGLRVAIEAPLATAESMAAAIANYFSPSTDSKARAV